MFLTFTVDDHRDCVGDSQTKEEIAMTTTGTAQIIQMFTPNTTMSLAYLALPPASVPGWILSPLWTVWLTAPCSYCDLSICQSLTRKIIFSKSPSSPISQDSVVVFGCWDVAECPKDAEANIIWASPTLLCLLTRCFTGSCFSVSIFPTSWLYISCQCYDPVILFFTLIRW